MTNTRQAAAPGHAVIYAVGMPGSAGTRVPELRTRVAAESWFLFDICFDRDNRAHPADRPGLRLALDRIRLGFATILVLDHGVFTSMPEPDWLSAAVHAAHGTFRPLAHADDDLVAPHPCVPGGPRAGHSEGGRDAVSLREAG